MSDENVLIEYTQYAEREGCYHPTTQTIGSLPTVPYTLRTLFGGTVALSPTPVPSGDEVVAMPDRVTDEIVHDIETFWRLRDRYEFLGVAYKRGILMHGRPGTGKSTTIGAVVRRMLDRKGIVILLQRSDPSDLAGMLKNIRGIEPDRPIVVVLEDVDNVIRSYGTSSLLALMDGEDQVDNICYVATTNDMSDLPESLTNRPSRFDRIVCVDPPSREARTAYLASKGIGSDMTQWLDCTDGFTVAHMKALVIDVKGFGYDINDAARRIRDMNVQVDDTDSTGSDLVAVSVSEPT